MSPKNAAKLADTIRRHRTAAGITQPDLAQAIGVPASVPAPVHRTLLW